jgi:leucyl-tRNA synthetase
MPINYPDVESKWQKAWAASHIYDAECSDAPPFFVNAAFPYVDAPHHIGHLRTYGTADLYSRYKRMRGFNVLYPMAFHGTGTPILAIAKRIAGGDAELIKNLKQFEIPDEDIARMKDQNFIVDYMMKLFEEGFNLSGFAIDWRRKFVSTEPIFSKMVEWQFQKLIEKGLLKQGSHPVGWCANEGNAVGQHDTKGDVSPEIEELTAICFKDAEADAYFACATYRPETVDGTTNLFVGEKIEYVVAKISGKRYYLSKNAAAKLAYQTGVEVEAPIAVAALLAKRAINPSNNELVPIFPGFFVKAEVGTGIVMSVPAHAPFDYAALERLRLSNYAVPAAAQYRSVITIKRPDTKPVTGGEIERARKSDATVPASAYLELMKSDPNLSDEMLELATKHLYREESRWGVMCFGKYTGKPEQEARELIRAGLLASGGAFKLYELINADPVICRCGYAVVVKTVEGQWFINYGDEKWKADTRRCMNGVRFYPRNISNTFDKVIDWIDMRAAERAQGLGTRFPLNKDHIIESLSDSTIYMTYYTYINIVREAQIKPEQLKPEFFDFVLLGKGDPKSVEESTQINELLIKKCRESFNYWYSYTSRHSGTDLVYNHLTMYMFNHVALFPENLWPKQIVTNGLVNFEGQKMSKSLGNIVPLNIGIKKYGADPLRFTVIATADLDTETDFRIEAVNSIRAKNDFLSKLIESLPEMKSSELSHNDYWLYSKLNSKIKRATEHMEELRFKDAYIEIYYNSINELKRYIERGGSNGLVVREFLEKLIIMISPVMPHIADEFWHMLGRETFAAQERWPSCDDSMINPEEEYLEQMIDSTISDARQVMELASKDKRAKTIKIIIADDWKTTAYNTLAREKSISKAIASDSLANLDKEKLSKFLLQFSKRINALSEVYAVKSDVVIKAFEASASYLFERLGVGILITSEEGSHSQRAQRALPGKPAIEIEW